MEARIYHLDDVDRPEEVAIILTDLEQRMANEVKALREELSGCLRKKPEKGKKKGFAMKKTLAVCALVGAIMFAAIPLFAQYTRDDISYDVVSNPVQLTQLLRDVLTEQTFWRFTPTDTAPAGGDLQEGVMYYNDTANTFRVYDGSTWQSLDLAGGSTLDAAYDMGGVGVGRTISATDGAVAISSTDADTAFLMTLNASPGSSAALGGMEITLGANSTENGIEFENTGSGDDIQGTGDLWAVTKAGVADFITVTLTGSDSTGTLLSIAGIDTTGDSDSIVVTHSGAGDALQITAGETDSVATRFIAAASQTTSLSVFDAATSNWDGADNIGMVHITADDPLIHAGASLLQVVNSGQPITAAEGFLARFVDTGTARTNAHAVEIECTNTTPALKLNNQLTITGTDSTGILLAVTGADTTGNTDTITVAHSGTGAALQITSSEADTQLIELISAANQTTWLQVIDGAAGNWIGANDVGMLTLKGDTAMAHVGASLLNIQSSAQPLASGEGFLARFVSSGTATATATAVEIEVPATQPALAVNGITKINGQDAAGAALLQIANVGASGNADGVTITSTGSGDALQITVGEADGVAQRNIAAASQTTSLAVFDGATSNWDGADNIGMVHITTDDPVIHTGASLLNVTQSGQAIAAAEGFLARFIASGAARTDATAVEIEVAATQPALAVNGITKINGQDAAGATLFQVAGVGASGNADAMLVSNTGSGTCLQITPGEADTGGIEITGLAASTVSNLLVDGATNTFNGADNVGMVHIKGDAAMADAGASLLQVRNDTGQPIAGAEGFLARFVDTGTARTDAYAVEIEVTATTGGLYSSGHATFEKGCQVLSQSVTATADGLTTGLIPDHASFVTVTSDSADKVVVLPTWVIGHHITIVVPATGCEVQTLDASNDTINTVDCDGSNELALTAAGIYHFWCVADSTWIAYGWAANGTAVAALTPDADA